MEKTITCPGCKTIFNIQPQMVGKRYKCKACSSIISIAQDFFQDNLSKKETMFVKINDDQNQANTKQNETMSGISTKQLVGIVGSVLLFLGVFMPIVSLPIVGSMNYFKNGQGDGVIVLILAIVSVVLLLKKNYKALWITGLSSLAIMLFTFFNVLSKISQLKADMDVKLAGNPFRGFADIAVQSIQLQWGWAILIVGTLLILAVPIIKNE